MTSNRFQSGFLYIFESLVSFCKYSECFNINNNVDKFICQLKLFEKNLVSFDQGLLKQRFEQQTHNLKNKNSEMYLSRVYPI